MNQLSDKEIRLMCLCKAIEVLVPNRFRFTATKDVPGPFLDTAKQFYDFVNADDATGLVHDAEPAIVEPDKMFYWTWDTLCGPAPSKEPAGKTANQRMWENSIQLEGLYTFNEAQEKCPKGYRIPVFTEWAWLIDNTEYAFDKEKKEGVFLFADGAELRLPAAGYRDYDSGNFYNQGKEGNYWSSSVNGTGARITYFNGDTVYADCYDRTHAFSARYIPIESQTQ